MVFLRSMRLLGNTIIPPIVYVARRNDTCSTSDIWAKTCASFFRSLRKEGIAESLDKKNSPDGE